MSLRTFLYLITAVAVAYALAGIARAPAVIYHDHTASRHGVCLEHGPRGGCLRWSYRRYRHPLPAPPVVQQPPISVHPRPPIQAQPF